MFKTKDNSKLKDTFQIVKHYKPLLQRFSKTTMGSSG